MRLYLAHPFDTRQHVRKLELRIEQDTGVELVNPFYDTGRTDAIEIDEGRTGRYEKLDPETLVTKDLAMIDSCDGLVAFVPGHQFSFGTPCECWYALTIDMPVYFISPEHHAHPWIRCIALRTGGDVMKSWCAFAQWLKLRKGYQEHE